MKDQLKKLILVAAGGKLNADDLADTGIDLRDIGLDSLGYLNLLEGIARSYDVVIDIEEEDDHTFLHTIDNLAVYLTDRVDA